MGSDEKWYIIQSESGHCDIVPHPSSEREAEKNYESGVANQSTNPKTWGPFSSRAEAIARRVGLIRAGKCQPKM